MRGATVDDVLRYQMMMQRFSRLIAPGRISRSRAATHSQRAIQQRQKGGHSRWLAALFGAVVAVASVSASPVNSNSDTSLGNSDTSLAVQGHAKRYMRINEYLFNGTQKTTAVAQRTESAHRHHV